MVKDVRYICLKACAQFVLITASSAHAALPWEKTKPVISESLRARRCEDKFKPSLTPTRGLSTIDLESAGPLFVSYRAFAAAKIAHHREEMDEAQLQHAREMFVKDVAAHFERIGVLTERKHGSSAFVIMPTFSVASELNEFAAATYSEGMETIGKEVNVVFDPDSVGVLSSGKSLMVALGGFESGELQINLSFDAVALGTPTYIETHERFHQRRFVQNYHGLKENFQFTVQSLTDMLSTRLRKENLYHQQYSGEEIIVALHELHWFVDVDLAGLSRAQATTYEEELLVDVSRLQEMLLSTGREFQLLIEQHVDLSAVAIDAPHDEGRFTHSIINSSGIASPLANSAGGLWKNDMKLIEPWTKEALKFWKSRVGADKFSIYLGIDKKKQIVTSFLLPGQSEAVERTTVVENLDANLRAWGQVNQALRLVLASLKAPGSTEARLHSVQRVLKRFLVDELLAGRRPQAERD